VLKVFDAINQNYLDRLNLDKIWIQYLSTNFVHTLRDKFFANKQGPPYICLQHVINLRDKYDKGNMFN